MVPMAPSRTRMRSLARRRSTASTGDISGCETDSDIRPTALLRGLLHCRPQAKKVADGIHQVGPVHRVEMKVGHAAIDEVEHLFGGDSGGNELARRRIIVEALEPVRQPVGNRGTATGGKAPRLLEILHRQDARHDRNVDAPRPDPIQIVEIEIVLEEELSYGSARPRIDLGGEHVEVSRYGGAIGMLFGIGGNRNLEVIRDALDAADEMCGISIPA